MQHDNSEPGCLSDPFSLQAYNEVASLEVSEKAGWVACQQLMTYPPYPVTRKEHQPVPKNAPFELSFFWLNPWLFGAGGRADGEKAPRSDQDESAIVEMFIDFHTSSTYGNFHQLSTMVI